MAVMLANSNRITPSAPDLVSNRTQMVEETSYNSEETCVDKVRWTRNSHSLHSLSAQLLSDAGVQTTDILSREKHDKSLLVGLELCQ